jgi:peptidoglycan/LPS O-acetylase OafA/YrhL
LMRAVEGVCVMSLTLAMAELMYRFVEQPGINAGKYFSGKYFSAKILIPTTSTDIEPLSVPMRAPL